MLKDILSKRGMRKAAIVMRLTLSTALNKAVTFVIKALTQQSFEVVIKGRWNAGLKYHSHGWQKRGKGRPVQFSGKVDLHGIDRNYFCRIKSGYDF